jgi:vitamin B12 transporter
MSFLLTLPRNVQVHAGLRLNTHSLYGAQLVYNINPSWVLPINSNAYLKLFASLSTAYITPSLFQLYTVWGGNKNLQPERDENAEAGFSVVLDKKVQSTFAYYYRTEMNAIGYSALLQYINVDVNRYVSGLTADVKWDMNSMFSVSVNYAYTHVNLPQTFFRIPGHKTGASLAFTSKGTSAQVRYLNTGKRTDSNYPDEVVLSAYDLVDVYVAQALYKKKFNVFMTVNNLLNEDFVAVYGYTTQGRNFSAGMKYVF